MTDQATARAVAEGLTEVERKALLPNSTEDRILAALEAPPLDGATSTERLGEALFILSDKLRQQSSFFEEKANHDAYERVVAAFQALKDTDRG